MARDRQRAKQRQQRRQSSGGSDASRKKKSRARDAGVDDPQIEETGLTDAVEAPDPLKKASAEVELAKAAETGVEPSGPAEEVPLGGVQDAEPEPVAEVEEIDEVDEAEEPYDEDFEHALDESEDDQAHAAEVSLTKKEDRHPEHRKDRARFITFLGNCWEELKRVQWPNRRQVGQATAVVLGFVVLAGGYLGLMDAIWKPIVNAII